MPLEIPLGAQKNPDVQADTQNQWNETLCGWKPSNWTFKAPQVIPKSSQGWEHFPQSVGLKFERDQNLLEGLFKQIAGAALPQSFWLSRSGWALRICIHTFPGATDGLWIILWEPLL